MLAPDYGYAQEKLYEAVRALVGNAGLNMRLTHAAFPLLELRSHPVAVPPELKVRLDAVVDKLTKDPLGDKDHYALPRRMKGYNAKAVAEEIFSMFVAAMGGLR